MPGTHYSNDSGEYTPILIGAPRADPRRRSPESQGQNIYLNLPTAVRPRAASTSGNAQPINLHISPTDHDTRSRSRHRHHSRHSSSSSDRSRRSRRGSRYEYDNLPYDLRKELDFAKESRAEERSRSRERRRDRDRARFEDDYEDRKKKEQREKDKIIADAKEAEDKRKKEDEKLRQKILDEEEEKKKKKRKEKELEDKIFEEKVREKFKAAGYSDAHIDEVLHRKREKRREGDREWAIDLSRPTFIKVNRKYLSPATLDHFHLPWEWDKGNNEYIIIKKYIDHAFQDELFEHTKILKEKKLITSGYEKDVTVTLRPADVYKKNDEMYLVRTKSKSPGGRSRRSSWMFT